MQLRTAISICVSSPTVTITSDHLRVSVQEQVDVTPARLRVPLSIGMFSSASQRSYSRCLVPPSSIQSFFLSFCSLSLLSRFPYLLLVLVDQKKILLAICAGKHVSCISPTTNDQGILLTACYLIPYMQPDLPNFYTDTFTSVQYIQTMTIHLPSKVSAHLQFTYHFFIPLL